MEKRSLGKYKAMLITAVVLAVLLTVGNIEGANFWLEQRQIYAAYQVVPDIEIADSEKKSLEASDFLTASGDRLVTQDGETVVLRGTNLGGWLLQEYWMCPVWGDSSVQWTNLETLTVLEERFGEEKARHLIETYQKNWITEWDIRNIASHGCNVIRVPFWYRNFMADADGTWIAENPDENPGFQTLDWLIETAGKYGLYVVLDMHGCPGGQSTDHSSGSARNCELFENENYQNAMEQLWTAIARRYKDSPVVAAYDIMNEPQEYSGSILSDPRNAVYNRMIKAIRAVDDKHVIALEGIWSLSVLPLPEDAGWTNVIYEIHPYGASDMEGYCRSLTEYSRKNQVPVYIGEFSNMNVLEICGRMGISCTSWTYKGTVRADGTWFMYYSDRAAADVYNDPYWLIELKWGRCLATQFFDEMHEVTEHWDDDKK